MRSKNRPWFDDQRRHAVGLKQEAHLRWTRDRSRVNWEEFVRCQVGANETYTEAKRQFSDRNMAVLMNVQSPHKWWSTFKSAVFGTSLSFPLFNECGGLVCESVGKADLLSNHFNSIIHFIEARLQYNWHNNKNTDGLVNRLASNLVILNEAHMVAWLIGKEKILK